MVTILSQPRFDNHNEDQDEDAEEELLSNL